MSSPVPTESDSESPEVPAAEVQHPHATHGDHLDPITGEPHAHPVGVGVGALSAGAAGAAFGALVAGPIGVVVGAAIGAIAGGLAGKEVAEEPKVTPNPEDGTTLDEFDHDRTAEAQEEVPLSNTLAEHTSPTDDDFFTGGHVGGHEVSQTETALDDFDRPRVASTAAAAVPVSGAFTDDKPLPTASSGLITPDESSFFADSTTGESSVLTESPFPAGRAVDAEGSGEKSATTSHFAEEPEFKTAPDAPVETSSFDTKLAASEMPAAASSFTADSDVNPVVAMPTTASSFAGQSEAGTASSHVEAGATTNTEPAPAEHIIRTGAYYRYLGRETTGTSGSDFTDWIEAEKEAQDR